MAQDTVTLPGPSRTPAQPAPTLDTALSRFPMRAPYPSELQYFKKNPHVAGMAAEDNAVILNPFSRLKPEQQAAVAQNERIRLFLRQQKIQPNFALTPQQAQTFKQYGKPIDIQHTIIARALSGDTSAGNLTQEQQAAIEAVRAQILQGAARP